ncbi:MAG: hypothetical protein WBP38_05470, partial [Hyphomicrobium sp.]
PSGLGHDDANAERPHKRVNGGVLRDTPDHSQVDMDDASRMLDDLHHGAAHVRLDLDDVARWAAAAKRLDFITAAVSMEIADLYRDPCRHRLQRCANAARFAWVNADEPERTIAVSLAEELERRVMRGH